MGLKANSRGNLRLGSGIGLGQLPALLEALLGARIKGLYVAEIRDQLGTQVGLSLGQVGAQ